MKKVVIIGRNGQVAWELQQEAPCGVELLVLGSQDIDILDKEALNKTVSAFAPDCIINASAYTAVDKAESDVEAAYAINETAVKNLAQVAKSLNCRLIHISTDFVFDGEKNTAYEVTDTPNPTGVYGSSKLAGEKAVESIYPDNSAVVRTSWVYSSHGNNFVKTMLKLMSEKEDLSVVADQIGCPTYAKGLAQFLWELVRVVSIEPIYHWSDLGVASWYDFAVAIQKLGLKNGLLTKKVPVSPIKTSQYPTPAKRPKFSVLAVRHCTTHSYHWTENLANMLEEK